MTDKPRGTSKISGLTIRIPISVRKNLEDLASTEDRSINWIVNDFIKKGLKNIDLYY